MRRVKKTQPKASVIEKFLDAMNEAKQMQFSEHEKAILQHVMDELGQLLEANKPTHQKQKKKLINENGIRIAGIASRLLMFFNAHGHEMGETMKEFLEHLKKIFVG